MLILLESRIGERHRRGCQERNERKSPPARCANESGCRVHVRLPKYVWLGEWNVWEVCSVDNLAAVDERP
jgi:hypothetical protein